MRTVITMPTGGTVFTTASDLGEGGLTLVTRTDVPSVVAPLGQVTLVQPQTVTPTALQDRPLPDQELQDHMPVPAAGTLRIEDGVLTGAGDTGSLHYCCGEAPFITDDTVTEPGGLHPIVFAGDLIVSEGTGPLAGACGTLHVTGRFSFTDNSGYFTISGEIEVPEQEAA